MTRRLTIAAVARLSRTSPFAPLRRVAPTSTQFLPASTVAVAAPAAANDDGARGEAETTNNKHKRRSIHA
jgi:hypothetical protein